MLLTYEAIYKYIRCNVYLFLRLTLSLSHNIDPVRLFSQALFRGHYQIYYYTGNYCEMHQISTQDGLGPLSEGHDPGATDLDGYF